MANDPYIVRHQDSEQGVTVCYLLLSLGPGASLPPLCWPFSPRGGKGDELYC